MVSRSMLDLLSKSVTETGRFIYRFSIIHLPRTQIRFIQYGLNINFSADSMVNFFFFHSLFLPDDAM